MIPWPPLRQWPILVLLCIVPILTACGQRGDLYLPDEPVQQAQEPEQTEEEKAQP
jgi:predicted small lipoprotein YifL